jgi:hypothetical protein
MSHHRHHRMLQITTLLACIQCILSFVHHSTCTTTSSSIGNKVKYNSKLSFGPHLTSGTRARSASVSMGWMTKDGNDSDKDELFDPLLSPHAYGSKEKKDNNNKNNLDVNDDDWSPMKMNSIKDDFKGAAYEEYGVEKSVFTRKWSASANEVSNTNVGIDTDADTDTSSNKNVEDDASTFDPLISPHRYSKGTSSKPTIPSTTQKPQKRIGILLIDHGSRREASNTHLENLAALYSQRSPSHYVVRAAHMEIAKPSIMDGMKDLIENENVDKIVCHPYFLSPGRHVVEDIPELIEEAIHELKIGKEYGSGSSSGSNNSHVEVVTTTHVGSSMERMVNMIDATVGEAIGIEEVEDTGFVKKDTSSLGGFFGEVQRMLDEQL